MYASTIFAALAASVAFASPLPQTDFSSSNGPKHSVDLKVITSPFGAAETFTIVSAELNYLTPVHDTSIYEIQLVLGSSQNVDENKIECRAYKDTYGVQPGSAPFNVKDSALISTTGVVEAAVLCYRVTDGEASDF